MINPDQKALAIDDSELVEFVRTLQPLLLESPALARDIAAQVARRGDWMVTVRAELDPKTRAVALKVRPSAAALQTLNLYRPRK